MKKIMIIAGGDWQVPIIKKTKEMGFFVINSNLYPDSPGFEFADIGEVADVIDRNKNLEIAKKYSPDAVITDQSDIAVSTVAYVADKIGVPGIGNEKAELFTNKYMMREFCKNNNFIYPKYELVNSIEKAINFANEIGYPVVLKPTNSQSSRGVIKVSNEIELKKQYENTLKFCINNIMLVEEFIGGFELTVEGFKFYDRHISLAISKKNHLPHNEMIADELLYMPFDEEIDFGRLKEINNKLVDEMQLPFGITHAEYKYYKGDFYLIEIAARGGGTKISSHIVPAITGIDINELLIKSALGEKILSTSLGEIKQGYAILEFFQFPEGKVKKLIGIDALEGNPNVLDFGMNFKVGDTIELPKDDRSRHGYFILKDDNLLKLNQTRKQIREIVKTVY